MNRTLNRHPHWPPEEWLALAAGDASELDASEARAHRATCAACREVHAEAEAIQQEALALRVASVDDITRERLWSALAPHATEAAHRTSRRRAWQTLVGDAGARLSAAAAVLLVTGAVLAGTWLAHRTPDPGPPALEIGGQHASLHGARALLVAAVAQGPESLLGARPWPRLAPGPSPAAPRLAHRGRARRRASPTRGNRGLRPRAGERRLRCGGLLALGAARATVVRDDARVAVVQLRSGHVRLRVPRLPAGGRLEVITPDARVQVKGTRFTVKRGAPGRTTVRVTEGTVWVTPTGRNRQTRVLRVGQQATVLGEEAYLQGLATRMSGALQSGRLTEAARLGRRYLAVLSRPAGASAIRLRLAGVLARLGELHQAVRIYRQVASQAPQAVARQNAMAFLARLYERRGQTTDARRVWRQLAQRFPRGLYERAALHRLVSATCLKPTTAAQAWRRRLAHYARSHAASRALLTRCTSKEGTHAP